MELAGSQVLLLKDFVCTNAQMLKHNNQVVDTNACPSDAWSAPAILRRNVDVIDRLNSHLKPPLPGWPYTSCSRNEPPQLIIQFTTACCIPHQCQILDDVGDLLAVLARDDDHARMCFLFDQPSLMLGSHGIGIM